MKYKSSQSILSWAVILGTVTTLVLSITPVFRRILIKKIKQITNLALWTEEGPRTWSENGVFIEEGVVGLQYKEDEVKGEQKSTTTTRLNYKENRGIINYQEETKTTTSLDQKSVGDGWEDLLQYQ